jgi:hypothetical protein
MSNMLEGDNLLLSILIIPLIGMPILGCVFFTIFLQLGYGQNEINNWQTYVDPDKRFTLFYPPGWTIKGKENFLSSIDLTLTNPNSTKPFQVTITYIVNDSSLNYTGNEIIVPENNLRILEGQLRGAYQLYTFVRVRRHIAYMAFLRQAILWIIQNITDRMAAF